MDRPPPKPALARRLMAAAALWLALALPGAQAFERLDFAVAPGTESALLRDLKAASGLLAAKSARRTEALELFAEARAEYGRLLAALYAAGHYAPVISVRLDGREAADIAPLDAPATIDVIAVSIDPGPAFRFGRTVIQPLAPGTELPRGFAPGRPAESGAVVAATGAAVEAWRQRGHAKAAAGAQDLVADHGAATLDVAIEISPGPVLRFGPLRITGTQRLRLDRALAIAGLPEGARFSSAELRRVAERLRRTGIFSSVSLTEDAAITPPDLLGTRIDLIEAPLRRYTLGAELASRDGLVLSGSWLHRNLLGGGERFEIGFDITGIAAQSGGADYRLGVKLDRPATPDPDTALNLALDLARIDDANARLDEARVSLGLTRYFSDVAQGHAGFGLALSKGSDAAGPFTYRAAEFPLGLTWDRRDSKTQPSRLFYLDLGAKPFYGFGSTASGARLTFDARGYRSLDDNQRLVLALRLQGGAVLGASLLDAPRGDLFFSGGGGTVRGQPYQSLGVTVLDDATPVTLGGTRFLAASAEARLALVGRFGLAAFADLGWVGQQGEGDWHAGAGLGLRYDTGIGPIRLDLALPIGGTGHGMQAYVGLGQAF